MTQVKNIPFLAKEGSITFIFENRSHTILSDDSRYNLILSFLKKKDFDSIANVLKNVSVKQAVNSVIPVSTGLVVNSDGTFTFKGEKVENSVVSRIQKFVEQGLPFEPLVKFLENLMSNPSFNSRKQLYSFLEHNDIPITEDGCFFSYKAVRADFYDKHSGTIHNGIGKVIRMDRNKIDDNPDNHCSSGLHVGALEYVKWFGNGSQDKILICKVNPKDVVSVPNDHNARKVRVCEYKIVDFYTGPLYDNLYDDNIQSKASQYGEFYDDLKEEYNDWEDEEDDLYCDDELDYLCDDCQDDNQDDDDLRCYEVTEVKPTVKPLTNGNSVGNDNWVGQPRDSYGRFSSRR